LTYGDLEDGLIHSSSQAGDGVGTDHISHRVHLGLPDRAGKHDERGDDVDWPSAQSKRNGDEEETTNGQRCHIRGIAIIEDIIAHSQFGVEVLPERNSDTETGTAVNIGRA
jgi:hypothetical protein